MGKSNPVQWKEYFFGQTFSIKPMVKPVEEPVEEEG